MLPPRGRGAASNPPNRFETIWLDPNAPGAGVEEWPDEDEPALPTQVFQETARSILAHNDSPDIGFDTSINAYRGCEHGCIYCYARPTHEYLGFSSGLDFETKIVVKTNAPQLLRKELSARSWKPRVVSMSGVTDCYQPLERKWGLTRACLEVFADFRNPIVVITKNFLVTRDIEILQKLARFKAVSVCISLTTLDAKLARQMEPRASTPHKRLEALEKLNAAGIPAGVLVCPVVPGLTDTEIPAILNAAAKAGARFAGYNILALPYANKDLFLEWLHANFPDRAAKVESKIRQVRGGKLYDADFGQRMTGSGPVADQIGGLFKLAHKKARIPARGPKLCADHFRVPVEGQLELFEEANP